jgi:hypothetical protein
MSLDSAELAPARAGREEMRALRDVLWLCLREEFGRRH